VDQPYWLAPEVIMRQPYTEKADIYAFGIILWEMINRKHHPFDEFPFGAFMARLEDAIVGGARPTIPADTPPQYKKLISDCWHGNPELRPSFQSILQILANHKISEKPKEGEDKLSHYLFDLPDTEDNIVKDELGIPKLASIEKLIERFTREGYRGESFSAMTFVCFCFFLSNFSFCCCCCCWG
jgi:serine/threonine protein kinase